MKIAEGSPAWYELPFSRRVELSRIAPADMPELSEECRKNLVAALAPSFSRARFVRTRTVKSPWSERKRTVRNVHFRQTVPAKFWENLCKKCQKTFSFRFNGMYPTSELKSALSPRESWSEIKHDHLNVIDFLELMFRTPGMPKHLADKIENALDDSLYHIDYSVTPVSVQLTEQHANTKAAQRAIRLARNAGMTAAANHLQKSEKKIGVSDYPGALDECGRALESIVQIIDPDTKKKSLGACLKSPKIKEIFKHSALHGAIIQLYGYLSDEAGVRHSRGNEKSKIDRELAIFFYDVSAAFVEYLVSAHRKSKKYGKKKKK
ncbi:MAG: hypothetical protein MPK09_08660 [Gammaproteobacteria bacterium]|nr:hypothetical protein [Gammaproteobacteria bacterium]